MPTTIEIMRDDPLTTLATLALLVLVFVVLVLPLLCGILYCIYFVLTLPMRRAERARFVLDIIEAGMQDGHTPERTIVDAARSGDRSLGWSFQRLGGFLANGMKLSIGLELVPRLVPASVAAMLKGGEKLGDIRQVLPACRQLLHDGSSQVRGALNYLIVLWFCFTPVIVAMLVMIRVRITPVFTEVFGGLYPQAHMPAFSQRVLGSSGWSIAFATIVIGALWFVTLCYIGGPYLARIVGNTLPGVPDRVAWWFPWRRMRLRRDFSAMLAVLLDGGVPEAEAVRIAGESTANRVMMNLAGKVRSRLAAGVNLTEALAALDDAGELKWRITNVLPGRGGFRHSLAGWHATLDARAFQKEQTAAQVLTTGIVLFNGALIGSLVFAVYLALISLIQEATLW